MDNNSLTYATDALNVKSLFYNKEISIYVEGEEDILFWEKIFSSYASINYHIEDTNGYEKLKEYMDKIIKDDARIIIACDCDHSPFALNNKYDNPRIVRTYGYSIENTMYCVNNINYTVKRYSKSRKDFTNDIIRWYNDFCAHCLNLLYYDIANHRFSKSIKGLGDNCCRFLKSESSPDIAPDKVKKYISKIKNKFDVNEINECIELVRKDNRELRFLIKGHFLDNGIFNFVKSTAEQELKANVDLSFDGLYASTVNCIVACNNKCVDMLALYERVDKSIKSVT
jgi:hypothetical protein